MFGFVRQAQRLLPTENAFYNVPDSLTSLILSYYHISECFDKWDADHIRVNADHSTATMLSFNTGKTIYGREQVIEIPHALYRWTFSSIKDNSWIFIGIDSSDSAHIKVDYTECNNECSFYSCGSSVKITQKGEDFTDFEKEWRDYNTIMMEVDTKQKSMKFIFDEIEESTVFKNIEFKNEKVYRLAILMGDHEESITLDNFEFIRME